MEKEAALDLGFYFLGDVRGEIINGKRQGGGRREDREGMGWSAWRREKKQHLPGGAGWLGEICGHR